jgi:capsular exopolysaccharide synthesis family protein
MDGDLTTSRDSGGSRRLTLRAPQGFPAAVPSGAFWGDETEGRDPTFDLNEYWRLLMKHRLVILVAVVLALAVGAAATLLMRPQYTAVTQLQIDREAAKVVNDDVAPRESMIQGEEFFQTQYGLLKSRSLAIRVMDTLGLASSDDFLQKMKGGKAAARPATPLTAQSLRQRREKVLQTIQHHLKIDPVRGSRLVNVSFESPNADLSALIANAFAENFIQSNLDRRFDSSSYARDFLEKRLAQVKGKLEDTERQLVAYASAQQIINVAEPGDKGGAPQSLAGSNLSAINTALAAAKIDRVRAQERWNKARSAPIMSVPDVLASQTIQQLSQEAAKQQADYQRNLRLYKPDFPEMLQQKAQIDETNKQIQMAAANIVNSIKDQYEVAVSQEAALQQQVNGLKSNVLDLRSRSIQYDILQRELDTSRTLYDGLLQRYKEIGVAGGVTTNNLSVVDRADPPLKPSSPNALLNMGLALFAGLGLGVLSAFVMEALDDGINTPDDVEAKLGASLLGSIPLTEKGVTPEIALADIRSPFSEAYYSLRTALQFSTPEGIPRSLVVTSARPSEGKSTTAMAIAQNLARVGMRTLIVDGDLRNPSLHRGLKLENGRGLTNILAGASAFSDVIQATQQPNLSFIACGPLPPNPAELLGGSRLPSFIREAGAVYDIVIIDGPPVLGLADAPVLASLVGGVIFVLESRGTRRGQARGALRRLRMANANVLGVVLTKFSAKATWYGSGYDYGYDYQYGLENTAEQKKRRIRAA